MPFYVLKLGGSLIDSARSLLLGLTDLESKGYSFLVVPGGGPFADLVRSQFHEYSISDEAAHWMAILAMEQYAYFDRIPWYVAPNQPKNAHQNAIWFDVRYVLPGGAPSIKY